MSGRVYSGHFPLVTESSMLTLLGGSGFIGTAIRRELDACGLPYQSISRAEVDYTNRSHLREYLRSVQPRFLINSAGFTGRPNVDACERARAECLFGNAVLPGLIREVCEELQLPWGHISSGCIYEGTKPDGSGFTEVDEPNFCFRSNRSSFYSGTKALGEEVLQGAEQCFVWRLRIPFGAEDSERNYLSKLMRYERLLDARNSLSQVQEFAASCISGWQREIPFGIYNLTNPGSISTREVTEMMTASGGISKQFKFFPNDDEFYQQAATAPRSNCILDSSKATAAGIGMSPIREALEKTLRKWTGM